MKYPKCKGGLPHDYRVREVDDRMLDFPNAVYEICVMCGKKTRWVKNPKTGKMRNIDDYALHHIRDFAQNYGRTKKIYQMLYGTPVRDLTKPGTNA